MAAARSLSVEVEVSNTVRPTLKVTSDSSPFRLSDVTFSVGRTVFDTSNFTDNDLAAATFVNLTFTTQKNGVQGEKSAMGPQGTPIYSSRRPCAGA